MIKREFYYPSANDELQIHAVEWSPEERPQAILQIVHGMAEYIDRYDRTATWFAERGILVIGEDHPGHGKSTAKNQPYGYFGKGDTVQELLDNVEALRVRTREQYPDIPYIILGHSMGSFILRNYLCSYGKDIDGAIVMGTGMTPAGLLKVSLTLVKVLTALQGPKHVSKLINFMAFGSYCKRIKDAVTEFDWLSTDGTEVARYVEDPLCGFTFTLNGFRTLFTLLMRLHDAAYLQQMKRELPILFVSGKEDPVGDYGKAVEQTADAFRKLGMKQVTLKLYEHDRHEILNEADRELVRKDLIDWIHAL